MPGGTPHCVVNFGDIKLASSHQFLDVVVGSKKLLLLLNRVLAVFEPPGQFP